MIHPNKVWSLSDPVTLDASYTKSSVLQAIASLAYIDLFLHQVPHPEQIWNQQVVNRLSIAHTLILKHAARHFQKDDVDVLSNLLNITATGNSQRVLRVFMTDADQTTIELVRWVLFCRGFNHTGDITVPVFLIDPDITLYKTEALRVSIVSQSSNKTPFVNWCAVILGSLIGVEQYPFSTMLGTYVCGIKIPVKATLQPTEDLPYPYTSFMMRRSFFNAFYSDSPIRNISFLKNMSREFVRGASDELYVAQVDGMEALYREACVVVKSLYPDCPSANTILFSPDTAYLETLPRTIQNKLYSDSAGTPTGLSGPYGIGIESFLMQVDPSDTGDEDDDDDDLGPVKGHETTESDSTSQDTAADSTTTDSGADSQTNETPLSTTPPPDDTDTSEDTSTGAPDVGSTTDTTDPSTAPYISSDSMDLITFDRNGENVNDTLYRDAVLELAKRINTDGSFPISIAARELLTAFVELYLYRVGIKDVKEFIGDLGLDGYLTAVDVSDETDDTSEATESEE